MSKKIKIGQKLYHFAYGPLTVTSVKHEQWGDYVDTVADYPQGFRQPNYSFQPTQTWVLDTIGHWLFETPEEVGSENNDFDWKKHWPESNGDFLYPIKNARDKNNWHEFFLSNARLVDGPSPIGMRGDIGDGPSPIGIRGDTIDGPSPIGIKGDAVDGPSPIGMK